MKRLITIIIAFLLFAQVSMSQQNVVILVDVSGSIPPVARTQTKNVLKDVLMGKPISDPSFYYEKDPSSSLDINGTPMVANGSQLLLIPFGNKATSDRYAEIKLSNYPGDLINFIDINYPTTFNDGFTYLTLARAKAAQLAKQKGMSKFMLMLISDNISDFTGGKSPNYTPYEQQLVDNYNSKSNPITEGGVDGFVRLRGNSDFKIPIRAMDVSKYQAVQNPGPGTGSTTTPPKPADSILSIEFTGAMATATRKKPAVLKSNNVNVSWQCRNCPDNMRYSMIVTQIEGGKFRDANSKNISTPSVMKKLETGVYKITVSGEVPYKNMPVSGAITYVSVETGSAWWLWLLLIAAIIGGAIYMNKENQKTKIRKEGKERSSILDSSPNKDKPFANDEF